MSEHQRNVRKALEGNERVWYHPTDEKLAVWHGGAQIIIVSSRTFEQMEMLTISAIGRSFEQMEDEATVKLAQRGFERTGRAPQETRLIEA